MGFGKVNPKAKSGFNDPSGPGGIINTNPTPILNATTNSKSLIIGYGGGTNITVLNPLDITNLGQCGSGGFFAGTNLNASNITNGNSTGDNIIFWTGTNRTGSGAGAGGVPYKLTMSGATVNNIIMSTSTTNNFTLSAQPNTVFIGSLASSGSSPGSQSTGLGGGINPAGSSSVAIGVGANASGIAAVAIGYTAASTASSAPSVAIGSSASAANNGAVAVGWSTSAAANYSVALGPATQGTGAYSIGLGYTAYTNYFAASIAIGSNAQTDFAGEQNICNAGFATAGDIHTSQFPYYAYTTNATPKELSTSAGTLTTSPSGYITLSNNATYAFTIDIVAQVKGGASDCAMWTTQFLIQRGANAASTALVGSPIINTIALSGGAFVNSWGVAVTADTTNGRPAIKVTGAASTNISWVANVKMTKCGY